MKLIWRPSWKHSSTSVIYILYTIWISISRINTLDFRIFDKDNDGFLTTDELRKIMKGRMSKKDLDMMVKEADSDNDGFINCKGVKND